MRRLLTSVILVGLAATSLAAAPAPDRATFGAVTTLHASGDGVIRLGLADHAMLAAWGDDRVGDGSAVELDDAIDGMVALMFTPVADGRARWASDVLAVIRPTPTSPIRSRVIRGDGFPQQGDTGHLLRAGAYEVAILADGPITARIRLQEPILGGPQPGPVVEHDVSAATIAARHAVVPDEATPTADAALTWGGGVTFDATPGSVAIGLLDVEFAVPDAKSYTLSVCDHAGAPEVGFNSMCMEPGSPGLTFGFSCALCVGGGQPLRDYLFVGKADGPRRSLGIGLVSATPLFVQLDMLVFTP